MSLLKTENIAQVYSQKYIDSFETIFSVSKFIVMGQCWSLPLITNNYPWSTSGNVVFEVLDRSSKSAILISKH